MFALVGDGESDEGQVYEMAHFANKYKLGNLTLFMDYNRVQLTAALDKIMPIEPKAFFESAGWNVIEIDGHDYQAIWKAIGSSAKSDRPTLILGHTIMGKGVSFMEPDGKALKSTWHGVAPKKEVADKALAGELKISAQEQSELDAFRKLVKWKPAKPTHTESLAVMKSVKTGKETRS